MLILYMIFVCHIGDSSGSDKPTLISTIIGQMSWFMAWFFFKGGMMHKEKTMAEMIRKSASRLLIPYWIFLLAGILIDGVTAYMFHRGLTIISFAKEEINTFLTNAAMWPTAVCWFLLSLFVARITFNALFQRLHPLIISLIFLGLANLLSLYSPVFYLGTMCHGITIYSIGYYLREKQFDNRIFLLAAVIFAMKFFFLAVIEFRDNNAWGTIYLLAIAYEVAGCIVFNWVFRKWLNFQIPLLTYIGRNSMVYYLIHYPVMFAMTTLFWHPFAGYGWWTRYLILSFVVVIALIIADFIFRNKRMRFIIGG